MTVISWVNLNLKSVMFLFLLSIVNWMKAVNGLVWQGRYSIEPIFLGSGDLSFIHFPR